MLKNQGTAEVHKQLFSKHAMADMVTYHRIRDQVADMTQGLSQEFRTKVVSGEYTVLQDTEAESMLSRVVLVV